MSLRDRLRLWVIRWVVRLLDLLLPEETEQALVGDLLEMSSGRHGVLLLLREALVLLGQRTVHAVSPRWRIPLAAAGFATGWSALYPHWTEAQTSFFGTANWQQWSDAGWPLSTCSQVARALLPAMLFVQAGVLLWSLGRRSEGVERRLGYLLLGASASTSVLLGFAVILMARLSPRGLDLQMLARGDLWQTWPVHGWSLALCLSLLTAIACAEAGRAQRLRRRQHGMPGAVWRRRWLGLLLLTAAPAAAESSAAPVPAGAAGQRLQQWVESYDGRDWNAYEGYVRREFVAPPGMRFEDPGFREMTGGFAVREMEKETPTEVTALLEEKNSDQMARAHMVIEGDGAHRIVRLEVDAIPRPAAFALPHLREAELVGALRERLQSLAAKDMFAGAVLLLRGDTPLFAEAYGMASRERRVENTLQTKFRMGSMNKMITAVATLQLVEAGRLSLDAPVGRYLPDYPNAAIAKQVTLRELLEHTGGTGDIFGPEFESHKRTLRTHEDYVSLYGARAPLFPPGSRWEYSNYGFVLLGTVIDRVAGESYYEYVRHHIYGPAGMESTGSEPEEVAVPGRSTGYTRMGGGGLHSNVATLPYRGTSAGGGYTTVGDLARFAAALQAGRLLPARDVALLTTGVHMTPFGNGYGMGFDNLILNGMKCFGHDGAAPGMSGAMQVCAAEGLTVIALANEDPPAAQRVVEFVVARMPRSH